MSDRPPRLPRLVAATGGFTSANEKPAGTDPQLRIAQAATAITSKVSLEEAFVALFGDIGRAGDGVGVAEILAPAPHLRLVERLRLVANGVNVPSTENDTA